MAWLASGAEGNRPPRPLVALAEQLAVAAACDFSRRLAELVVDDALVGGPSGETPDTSRQRSASGGGTSESEQERADAEELAALRSRMNSLAIMFSDRFMTSVDEQVLALWNRQPGDGDATLSSGLVIKKGGKLRRSFKKKFSRRKAKSSKEEEAERKQFKKLEKEGHLKQLVDVQWVKCRVALRRQAGGFMLSFFSPPKAANPRSGVFCFLLTEVRQTTMEELPDTDHSFVIKGVNNMEYILLAHSNTEMWSWIAALRECSRMDSIKRDIKGGENGGEYVVGSDEEDEDDEPPPPPPPDEASQDGLEPPPLPGEEDGGTGEGAQLAGGRGGGGRGRGGGIANARSDNSLDNLASPDHAAPAAAAAGVDPSPSRSAPRRQDSVDSAGDGTMEHIEKLFPQPWFHGMLSRQEATMLVCQGAAQAHGTFLVRQSESRQGQLVLTFNCRGRAKHIRLTVVRDGQCRVHQWTFDNVFHMLDYFKLHAVPLDNGVESDVVLTSFVVATLPGGPASPGGTVGSQVFERPYVNLPVGAGGKPKPDASSAATAAPGQEPFSPVQRGAPTSPAHLGPTEGSHPMYMNDMFPGGVMIAPPSIQALHERSASNPTVMLIPGAGPGSPLGDGAGVPGAGVSMPLRMAVTPSGGHVSQPRGVGSADTAVRTLPMARPSNHYQLT